MSRSLTRARLWDVSLIDEARARGDSGCAIGSTGAAMSRSLTRARLWDVSLIDEARH
jgi:hypothetical protein